MLQVIINNKNNVKTHYIDKGITTCGPSADYDLVLEDTKNVSFTILKEKTFFKVLPIEQKTPKILKGKFNSEIKNPEIFQSKDLSIIFLPVSDAVTDASEGVRDWNFNDLPKNPTLSKYPEDLLNFLLESVGVEQGGLFYRQNGVLNILGQRNLNLRSNSTLILNRFLEQYDNQEVINLSFETHTMLFQEGLTPRNFILIRTLLDNATEVILYIPEPEKQNNVPAGILSTILYLASHGLSMHLAYQMDKKIFSRKSMELEGNYYWGKSEIMQRIRKISDKLRGTDLSVLIQGETGTGKEGLCEYLAKGKKIVSVNCASIPNNLAESTLFGHEKGSFTGAIKKQIGKIEEAHGGVLFLDEIGELPLEVQGKLLRFLQSGKIEPIGGKEKTVRTRVIAATHRDLNQMILDEKFREDLYFRINEANIKLPPLRERVEDIATLAALFLDDFVSRNNLSKKYFSGDAKDYLERQKWTGNIRELRSTIRRAALMIDEDLIYQSDLEGHIEQKLSSKKEYPLDLNLAKKMFVADQVKKALRITKGNKTKAAKVLGITGRTFFRMMNDINADSFGREYDEDVTPPNITC